MDPTELSDWSEYLQRAPMPDLPPTNSFWIVTSASASPDTKGDLQERFQDLASQWKKDTAHQSMLTNKVMHPAYQEIMRMGDPAISLILEELESAPDHWFWALHFLTGEQPVPNDFRGTITDAARIWVSWGRRQGLLADAGQRAFWTLSKTQALPTRNN